MTKKHLVACCLVCVFMVSAEINKGNTLLTHGINTPHKPGLDAPDDSTGEEERLLSFANELIPLDNEKVAYRMNAHLKAHRFSRIQTNRLHYRAARWFPVIEPILRRYGIPQDFKYIPLVESGMSKGPDSPKGASGFWQFMPGTARNYGLRVDRHIDERKDVRKATVAACLYLKDMYSYFNNWTLVAAAYNVGENAIKKELGRGNDNYYEMKLNRETASYVYKLVSMKEIIENPVEYGFKEGSLYAYKVGLPKQMPFAERRMDMAALQALHLLKPALL